MAMNLVRTGSAAGVGVASGVLMGMKAQGNLQDLQLGTMTVSWAAIAEAAALLGGAALQFMSPFTAPNLADGLVDGGAALVGARATGWAMSQAAAPYLAPRAMPVRVSPMLARPQVTDIGMTERRRVVSVT